MKLFREPRFLIEIIEEATQSTNPRKVTWVPQKTCCNYNIIVEFKASMSLLNLMNFHSIFSEDLVEFLLLPTMAQNYAWEFMSCYDLSSLRWNICWVINISIVIFDFNEMLMMSFGFSIKIKAKNVRGYCDLINYCAWRYLHFTHILSHTKQCYINIIKVYHYMKQSSYFLVTPLFHFNRYERRKKRQLITLLVFFYTAVTSYVTTFTRQMKRNNII